MQRPLHREVVRVRARRVLVYRSEPVNHLDHEVGVRVASPLTVGDYVDSIITIMNHAAESILERSTWSTSGASRVQVSGSSISWTILWPRHASNDGDGKQPGVRHQSTGHFGLRNDCCRAANVLRSLRAVNVSAWRIMPPFTNCQNAEM